MSLLAGWRPTDRETVESAPDGALVAEFQRSGSKEIFGMLVERYQGRVLRLVASILGPGFAAEAEDLTQDVFLQVYRKLPRFRGDSKFETWLYRVAYNRGIDRKRRARFRLPHLGEEALDGRPAADDPYGDAVGREKRGRVAAAVADLNEPARTVVHLYYWMETPVAEIAEIMGMRPGTVKSHLYRARQRLARRLDKEQAR